MVEHIQTTIFKKYNNKQGSYVILSYGMNALGALNQSYSKYFEIKKDNQVCFSINIEVTDQLVQKYKGYTDETNNAEALINEIAPPIIITYINTDPSKDKSIRLTTNDCPNTLDVYLEQLNNQKFWSVVELIAHDKDKYVSKDGTKYYIPNSETRNALGYNISRFKKITETELNQLSSGDTVNDVKYCRLVRNEKVPDPVYAVFSKPVFEKRLVPNRETLTAFGKTLNDVESLSNEEFDLIPNGQQLIPVNAWDYDPFNKKPITSTMVNNTYVSGPNNQVNSGIVKQPVVNNMADTKIWWKSSWFQLIILLSALSAIVVAVLQLMNR